MEQDFYRPAIVWRMRENIIRGLFAFVVLGLVSSVLHPREDAMDHSRWKKLIKIG